MYSFRSLHIKSEVDVARDYTNEKDNWAQKLHKRAIGHRRVTIEEQSLEYIQIKNSIIFFIPPTVWLSIQRW